MMLFLELSGSSLGILFCYWLLDLSLRQEQALKAPLWLLVGLGVCLLALAPAWSWPSLLPVSVSRFDGLRLLCTLLLIFTSWNAATRDRDVVSRSPGLPERVLLLMLSLAAWLSPAAYFLAVALLSLRLHFWQHHATFPMRVLLLGAASLLFHQALEVLTSLFPHGMLRALAERTSASLSVLLTTFVVSHYLITALAKIALGPRPWSWALENRLHYLAASAYSWGWARFIPWSRYRHFVTLLKRVERPLQITIFALELLCLLAFLDQDLLGWFCLAFAGFHLGVLMVAGLFFWDWIVTDLLLGVLFLSLDPNVGSAGFGPSALLLGSLLLVVFPLRHKLWKPMPLGWYDSPLTQRVCYRVLGRSGQEYGLYGDFMCPHERLYGKVQGCYAFAGRVITYHLGETFRLDLRDAILEAGPSRSRLAELEAKFGIEPYSTRLTLQHLSYLKEFFRCINAGARKQVLPRWLRLLKAPGDQLFYWGELPAYRGQEPVSSVQLHYREEYFDGKVHHLLREELILSSRIPRARAPLPTPSEITPRQLDEYLLELAKGRLIELPAFKEGYLKGDDGAPTAEPLQPSNF